MLPNRYALSATLSNGFPPAKGGAVFNLARPGAGEACLGAFAEPRNEMETHAKAQRRKDQAFPRRHLPTLFWNDLRNANLCASASLREAIFPIPEFR
jgi:hypothetical protein